MTGQGTTADQAVNTAGVFVKLCINLSVENILVNGVCGRVSLNI